jgi:integrase/recombinase XerD
MSAETYVKTARLEQLPSGPLECHLPAFFLFLQSQGYSSATLPRKIQLTRHFSRWLGIRSLNFGDLDEMITGSFALNPPDFVRIRPGDSSTLYSLLTWLRDTDMIQQALPQSNNQYSSNIEEEFAFYLKNERGLSEVTIHRYVTVTTSFLTECSISNSSQFYNIKITDITRYLINRAGTENRKTLKGRVTALRSFFRFLLYRGDITVDLAASVPAVADWRQSQLPKHIAYEEVEQLLSSCDRSTAIGKRDYAVLSLLARLGLRAGEVLNMMLDDINWETGVVSIRGKGGRRDELPIAHDVGEAIASYLRYVRPQCKTRKVFIRFKAPFLGFSGHAAIGDIVRRAIARAGLNPPSKGAHLLRHSFATNMLRQGASLSEIGEVLRHSNPTTTEIYVKVDLTALGALAPSWPGGEE